MIRTTYPLLTKGKMTNGAQGRPDDTSPAGIEPRPVATFFRAPSFQISVKGSSLCVRVRARTAPNAQPVG